MAKSPLAESIYVLAKTFHTRPSSFIENRDFDWFKGGTVSSLLFDIAMTNEHEEREGSVQKAVERKSKSSSMRSLKKRQMKRSKGHA